MADASRVIDAFRAHKREYTGHPLDALTQADLDDINAALHRAEGRWKAGSATIRGPGGAVVASARAVSGAGGHPGGLTGPIQGVSDLQTRLGVTPDGKFGELSTAALSAALSNKQAPALTEAEFAAVALDLGVSVKLVKAVRKVEAPKGPFDDQGRPSILYEKHVFARNTAGRFNASHSELSAASWQPGTYGPFSAQYPKLARACALDPEAAFKACSWGAFQVLGENAISLGYPSAFDMALALTKSEAAHLDSFVRFVKVNGLVDELRQCKAGDPDSCIPFVSRYNGGGFRKNNYHVNLAQAML